VYKQDKMVVAVAQHTKDYIRPYGVGRRRFPYRFRDAMVLIIILGSLKLRKKIGPQTIMRRGGN
jgi:hypothetical protein